MPRTLSQAWSLRTESRRQVPDAPVATSADSVPGEVMQSAYVTTMQAIATGEAHAHRLLNAWAAQTQDPELARTLKLVALRSAELAAAFRRRLFELGVENSQVSPVVEAELEDQLRYARSQHSDRAKFEMLLGYDQAGSGRDPLAELFQHPDIDIESGALLGRYIATERDSERRLRAHWEKLSTMPGVTVPGGTPVDLKDIFAQLDRLTRTIEELKSLAQGPGPKELRH
jgi:hypothetical protein